MLNFKINPPIKKPTSTQFFQGQVSGHLYFLANGGKLVNLSAGWTYNEEETTTTLAALIPLPIGTKIEIEVE